ncbi:MAG: GNAT family N-acetyltransferase [Bacteroidia bacterium]|nr:GNAT family N-acetyltransferase [Bacteroidia bacterium]MDW8158150.1 GNAT family N-acetyltransferase [Bacteroidia bacterium]
MQVIDDTQKYREHVRQTDSLPIFFYDWWLDAVAGEKGWMGLLLVEDKKVIALWPLARKKKWGFWKIVMPPTTPYMGCFCELPLRQNTYAALSLEFRILNTLIDALPYFDDYHQTFYPLPINWQPFYWKGFRQTTRYTYCLSLEPSLEDIFAQFRPQTRTHIRKAKNSYVIVTDLDPALFYALNEKTFARQNIPIPYSYSFFINKDKILLEKQRRKIFFALNQQEQIVAALYLIWDKFTAYLHLMGSDSEHRGSDVGNLLVWEAICFAKRLELKSFDFEGSMLQPICTFFRSFGAMPVPYHQITKVRRWPLKIWYFSKELLGV